jgi:hypothetical protein
MAGAEGMSKKKKTICRYCKKPFTPCRYHPKQQVCLSESCQRRRKSECHRNRLAESPEYRDQCAESRKVWRENNPNYQRQYRADHPASVEQNRRKQRERNRIRRAQKRKERLSEIVKNSLAIDVKPLFSEVWMAGPFADEIVKNSLAISQVMILQTVAPKEALSAWDCKEQPFGIG